MKNKKGNAILDTLTIVIVVIVMAISLIFGSQVLDLTNADIQSDAEFSQEAKDVTGNLNTNYASLFDSLFLFAFILLIIFLLVSVFLLDTHPIFFIVSVVLLIFVFVVGGMLANTYNDIASDSDISSYANNFTYISWVMSHLLELVIAIAFLTSIVLFAKFKT